MRNIPPLKFTLKKTDFWKMCQKLEHWVATFAQIRMNALYAFDYQYPAFCLLLLDSPYKLISLVFPLHLDLSIYLPSTIIFFTSLPYSVFLNFLKGLWHQASMCSSPIFPSSKFKKKDYIYQIYTMLRENKESERTQTHNNLEKTARKRWVLLVKNSNGNKLFGTKK